MLLKFDAAYEECWRPAVAVAAELDALFSLAVVSGQSGVLGDTCRPEFVDVGDGETGVLDVKGLRHPCLTAG